MLLIFGFVFALALVVTARMQGRRRLDVVNLGWMSEQWRAEYNASHLNAR